MTAEITCPHCDCRAAPVDFPTVRFAVRQPFAIADLVDHDWAVCTTPDCSIYYFAVDAPDRTIAVGDLRRMPATKSADEDATFCFCFDLPRATVRGLDALAAIAYVRARVAAGECACDVLNPSGSCCLGSITAERKATGLPLR